MYTTKRNIKIYWGFNNNLCIYLQKKTANLESRSNSLDQIEEEYNESLRPSDRQNEFDEVDELSQQVQTKKERYSDKLDLSQISNTVLELEIITLIF